MKQFLNDNISMRISRITLLFGLFIVLSASFTQQIFFYCFEKFGRLQTENALGLFLVILAASCPIYLFKQPIQLYRKIGFFLLLALGLVLSWCIPLLAERIHVLEFGLLGYLAQKDNAAKGFKIKSIPYSLLIILLFGLLDETLQFFLPWRVCDLRDVALNLAGGSWGMGLFLLGKIRVFP